ncbi:MAG: PAS domain-containing protein [Brevundimonas sp.]|uniref:PAS domain-containing protein n=1 Tax=Brevundimonas sp. TaxID=1871086 RepID=UPI003001AB96
MKRQKSASVMMDGSGLEGPLDRLTALACTLFDMPHAVISVVNGDQTLFRANIGLDQNAMARDQSASNILVGMGPGAVLVVRDSHLHPTLKNHPMVTGHPRLRFFAGTTISDSRGKAIGAVGVMDVKPHPDFDESRVADLAQIGRLAAEFMERAELTRRQTERLELLRLAEEMAGVGQWRLDAETMAVTWSDEVYRIHGVDRETFDPNYDDAVSFYHPDDRGPLMGAIAHSLATGEGYKRRMRVIRRDGAERLVLTHADTERGPDGKVRAMFGVFQDVTEQERIHDAVAASERAFRNLAEQTSDIIAVFALDGTFRYVSPGITRLMGWERDDLIGRKTWDVIHPDDHAQVKQAYADFFAAGPGAPSPQLRYRGLHKDGSFRWLDAQPSILWDENGRPVEIQDNARDATATKQLEDDLMAERDRAEAAARAKTEFLANMSHELRTPLTSVIGFAGLLKQSSGLGPDERRYVDRIATSSDALLGVINDILDYSKLEAEAVGLDPLAFDPRVMIAGAVGIVENLCEAKGLTLTHSVEEAMPAGLMGDEGRLRQVTLNLVSNAVKFTGQGQVSVAATYADGRLRVAVTDTGIGISAEKAATLFRRFVQADASTTRTFGGTGLGLAISRRLIEMMGGTIGVDSQPGAGSTFWFEVPLVAADPGQDAQGSDGDATVDAGLRILMADDAAANRELVAAILGGMGLSLDGVENGAEAVEAVRRGGYDLVLMDVHMPVMDGLMATREIRAMAGGPGQTPIIALTANVQPEQVRLCHEAGMDAHVGKPIQVAELMATISRVLGASEVHEDLAATA